ncbi:hypothetical protein MUB16_00650 [Priestia sp. OVL9]|nr:hypothetical protein [Priestia sp. OVL9]
MKEEQLGIYRREHIGFIFQNYKLLDHLTIEENILLPAALKKEIRKVYRINFKNLLKSWK